MMDQVDFIEKHQKLRESADRVLGLSQSQRDFKDSTTILIYGGMSCGVKVRHSMKTFRIKRTKLLQSKSKQPRIVSVVCK